jgi:hypothetical protein
MSMKPFLWVFSMTCFSAAAWAQSYQYPSDPYSTTPRPQPTYQAPAYASGDSYEKLLSWGNLEARYNYYDYKISGVDNSSGFGAGLHVPLFKPLFLSFGLNWLNGDGPNHKSFDLTSISAGGGAFLPIGSRFQIFGEVGVRFDVASGDHFSLNSDDVAVYLRPGVRFAITEKWEVAASVLFATTDNFDNRVFEINSYYALLSVFDVGAGVDFTDDVNTLHAGLRLRW